MTDCNSHPCPVGGRCVKLVSYWLEIPVSTAAAERCFSFLTKLKQHLMTFDVERWHANFLMRCGTFCQDLYCPSIPFIQAPSIHELTQKTLWYPIWTSWVCWLKMHLCKSDLNGISKHLTMWFGSGLQKSDITCFFAVQTSRNQSGYAKNLIWADSLNKAIVFPAN